MSQLPAMPMWWGDFFSKTDHLSNEEQWAYAKLLAKTWIRNAMPFPDDPSDLARLLNMGVKRWLRIRSRIMPFFDLSGGTWRQERLEREWAYQQQKRDAQSANGRLGGRPSQGDKAVELTANDSHPATRFAENRFPAAHSRNQKTVSPTTLPEGVVFNNINEVTKAKVSVGLSTHTHTHTYTQEETESLSTESDSVLPPIAEVIDLVDDVASTLLGEQSEPTTGDVVEHMTEIWNRHCREFSLALPASPSRRRTALARWRDTFGRSFEQWENYCSRVAASLYLSGKVNGFRADLSWVLEPRNVPKIIEGRYDNRGTESRPDRAEERDARRSARNRRYIGALARAAMAGTVEPDPAGAGEPENGAERPAPLPGLAGAGDPDGDSPRARAARVDF